MYSASIYFFRIPWTTEMGHSLLSFNAIAIKLWENLQLHVLFSNNIIEFNLSGEKKIFAILGLLKVDSTYIKSHSLSKLRRSLKACFFNTK